MTDFSSRMARVGLTLASVALAVAAAEGGLRMVGYMPPEIVTADIRRTYRIEPHGKFIYRGYLEGMFSDFATPVKMNSLGFHDVEHAPERHSPDTYRLMVIGDSYVAALSVPLEAAFHRRLEARLEKGEPFGRRHYEVMAFGRSGHAQAREIEDVKYFGAMFRPDAVLLVFFCGNDIMENSPWTYVPARSFASMYRDVVAPRKKAFYDSVHVFPGSRLASLMAEAATSFYANHLHWFVPELQEEDLISPELDVYRVPLRPEWEDAYRRTADLLAAFKMETDRLGSQLFIAGLSGPQALGEVGQALIRAGGHSGIDPLQPERWLARWCQTHAVPYVALEPVLAAAGKHRVFWPHDGHLNVRGNEVIVEPLYRLVAGHPPPADGVMIN